MNLIIFVVSKFHGLLKIEFFDHVLEFFVDLINKVGMFGDWKQFGRSYPLQYQSFEATKKFIADPSRFLTSMAIVLRSPSSAEKGVLLVAYNYAFPSLALIFDLDKLLQTYHLVLEPSTARFFMPEILMFKSRPETIYIQTGEKRDERFLNRYMKNAVSVPVAANWWVDSRIFTPDPAPEKDVDIIMVSSWLKIKRHHLLFKTMRTLAEKGIRLKTVLVGYPIDLTKDDILAMAQKEGVEDRIEIYEWISLKEVAALYRRSRLNLLLSKREGFNRSLIEGLYCDVPCLIRKGFNFGDSYAYINELTGGYFTDSTLEECIMDVLNNTDRYQPHNWVRQNKMGPGAAAQILEKMIYGKMNDSVSPKTSGLNGMTYWSDTDTDKYRADYEKIFKMVRTGE